MSKVIMQINNLKISWSKLYKKYQVKTLDNRILEEFNALPHAIQFCEETRDFIKQKSLSWLKSGDKQ